MARWSFGANARDVQRKSTEPSVVRQLYRCRDLLVALDLLTKDGRRGGEHHDGVAPGPGGGYRVDELVLVGAWGQVKDVRNVRATVWLPSTGRRTTGPSSGEVLVRATPDMRGVARCTACPGTKQAPCGCGLRYRAKPASRRTRPVGGHV
jgi:hypothetical protein